jgi:transposase
MLGLPPSVRTFVVTQPIDGRKGADSLMTMVRALLAHDPLSGHLYVFFTRRCDGVRIVYWDRTGIAMWSKRLERGRFHPAFCKDGRLTAHAVESAELGLILEGIDLADARRRPRWKPTKRSTEIGNSEIARPV